MSPIAENIIRIRETLPAEVRLVAVSKFHPAASIQEAYDAGQRLFGESRVQELLQKQQQLPDDIEWHFIGHLQRNKVKMIIPFVSLIHSIDSPRLLAEVNKEAACAGRVVDCLLQIHIAQEESKFGFTVGECEAFLTSGAWREYTSVRICGVMGMATFTDDERQIRAEFDTLKRFFDRMKRACFPEEDFFTEISMGMSDDWPLAVASGSSMVRVGSCIFGARIY